MSKIALISTVKAPTNELLEFVNYHLGIGINEIILFFDDPKDEAIKFLENKPQVHCIVCTDKYWQQRKIQKPDSIEERQVININHGAKIAKANACTWLAHIDSDELIFNSINQSIGEILVKSKANIVRLAVREAIADHPYTHSVFSAKWFKKPVNPEKINKAIKLGSQKVFFEGEFFRGHLESKAFVKIDSKISRYGIHYPSDYDINCVIKWSDDIKLLHYDCIGFDAWKSKWDRRLDGSATANKMRINRKKQLQEYKNAKHLGHQQLLVLYKEMHMISTKNKLVLLLLGMIERIKISNNSN